MLTFLAHNNSSSTSQLIKGKSSDYFMKCLDYLWLIVNQDAWDQDTKILRCLSGKWLFCLEAVLGALLIDIFLLEGLAVALAATFSYS